MDKKIALIIAVIMGVVAVLMVKNYVSKATHQATAGLDLVKVVVANKNLSEGEAITKAKLAMREFPQKYVGDRAVRSAHLSMILGRDLLNNVEMGKPLFWSDVDLGKREGFASIIKPGMRAITVSVSAINSVGNKIRPGSRVDVLLTFNKSSIEKEEAESRRESEEIPDMKNIQAFREFLIRKYSKADESKSKQMTVVFKQNVLVLGVGDQYLGAESSRKADNYSHITLLVSLLGAQEVIHAQTMGSLSFVLRNDADVEQKVITPSNNETVFRSAITASVARQESTEESEEK